MRANSCLHVHSRHGAQDDGGALAVARLLQCLDGLDGANDEDSREGSSRNSGFCQHAKLTNSVINTLTVLKLGRTGVRNIVLTALSCVNYRYCDTGDT